MKETHQILQKLDLLGEDENAVLATVIDVKGSSYRLPGAKMLILENGESIGTVSGGCLEADVLERAKDVMESGNPQMFVYDTTNDEDSVFSFNMGCRGVIRILLESANNNPYINFFRQCFRENPGVAVTALAPKENFGKRLFFEEKPNDKAVSPDKHIWQDVCNVFDSGISAVKTSEEGNFFLEYIAPAVNINIFGAGADAVPLAEIAKGLGWRVTIIDHRSALANNERFLDPDKIILSRPEEILAKVPLQKDSIAVLMTHNYKHDKQILKTLLELDLKYIGLLGPRVRTENILDELREEDLRITDQNLKTLYAPVGLNIGAQLPETIAVSIIAEIQAVLSAREGGFLKHRKGSIYDRD